MGERGPILALLLLLLLSACPGELDLSKAPPLRPDGGASPVSTEAPDLFFPPPPGDGGTTLSSNGDGVTALLDGGLTPDTVPPPDTLPPPDTGRTQPAGTGGPCPCSAGTLCIENTCRAICNKPTGACGVTSNCPADHACLATTSSGVYVCVPAVQPGQACGKNAYCPVNHVCGAANSAAYSCLPICSLGPCGGGGKCVTASNGCAFCSSI